jgi:glycine amidinotransferase
MTKIVNSWNEWDPLKRVIVGRPEGTQIHAPEPGWEHHYPEFGYPIGTYGPMPQEMVDKANEQMDNFVAMMEGRGIIVDRVTIHPYLEGVNAYGTPDWTQLNARGINNPRDLFMTVGNEIIEASGTLRSRWFEYLHLRPLFEQYFKEDPEFLWTAAPKPRLTDASYEDNYYYNYREVWTEEEKDKRDRDWNYQLSEEEPLWDAADATRCGKDIFWHASSVTNRSGVDWLRRYFGAKGFRIHTVQFEHELHPWHMDINLIAVRPGLVVTNPAFPPIGDDVAKLMKANDWEIIEAAPATHHYPKQLNIIGEYFEGESWISMNTFSLGPNTICVEAHELRYIDQLTKLGFEVVPVEYDAVFAFGGELHCTTLDVYREGDLEDYFPKQIPGF